jgi:bifunctional enzyme CysN/CysC
VILIDARNGVVEQTRRHAYIASLVGIRHLVVCVNKMDLVGFDEQVYDLVTADFLEFAGKLDIPDITLIPVSALNGDNVVDRSAEMPWYEGPPLLYHLEHVHVASDRNHHDVRFPVQYVIRRCRTSITTTVATQGRWPVACCTRAMRSSCSRAAHGHASRRLTPSTASSTRHSRRSR